MSGRGVLNSLVEEELVMAWEVLGGGGQGISEG